MSAGRRLRVAVEGCGHGTLHSIYASVEKASHVKGWTGIDVLIIGGDFQAVRNATDLNCMAVPMKYREIGDFHEYYSGARVAPYLTIFVGGNHEASNYLWELYYGGWVAPNIYYMGAANVLRIGPLRIAGLSGIWKGYNYRKPHYERLPYNQDDVRSIYHVRESDVRKLLQVRTQVDVGLSHDWPQGVEWMGDFNTLFRKKDLFEADARAGKLGSTAAKTALEHLRPPHWFSAHLHIKYAAVIDHTKSKVSENGATPKKVISPRHGSAVVNEEEIDLDAGDDERVPDIATEVPTQKRNNDEIDLDEEFDDSLAQPINGTVSHAAPKTTDTVAAELRAQLPASFTKPLHEQVPEPPTTINNTVTQFLALDKCLPNRHFLQLLTIPSTHAEATTSDEPLRLSYDSEWLAITRVFANELQVGDPSAQVPRDKGRAHYLPLIEKAEKWLKENNFTNDKLVVPNNFTLTAPTYNPEQAITTREMPREYNNPQTSAFCALLDIPNPFAATEEEIQQKMKAGPRPDQPLEGGFGRGGGRRGGRFGRGGHGDRGGGGRGFSQGGRGRGRGRA